MAWPSIVTTFTNPNPTDRLNSPSHSSIETAQNNALTAIMNAVGTDSAVVGTLIGDVRSATSNGGGHVQTANKGGTGQTAFTKGDVLVAQSASALSKLAVGANGLALVADSTAQVGLSWALPAASNKIGVQTTSTLVTGPTGSVLYGTSVAANRIDPTNIVKFNGIVGKMAGTDGAFLYLSYGGAYVASVVFSPAIANTTLTGTIEGAVIGTGVSSQFSYMRVFLTDNTLTAGNIGVASSVLNWYSYGVSSVNTTIIQPLTVFGSIQGTGRVSIVSGPMIWESISG